MTALHVSSQSKRDVHFRRGTNLIPYNFFYHIFCLASTSGYLRKVLFATEGTIEALSKELYDWTVARS